MNKEKKIRVFISGHKGLVGSAMMRELKKRVQYHLISRERKKLDLIHRESVDRFFQEEKIDVTLLIAAKVGGIFANRTYPAEFIYENICIATNVIHSAFKAGKNKIIYWASSCIYPKHIERDLDETDLFKGPVESTNEPYALAKIAGLKLCQTYRKQYKMDYRCVVPANIYGPFDHFDLEKGHVIPSLMVKFHLGKLAENNQLEEISRFEKKHGPFSDELYSMLGLKREKTLQKVADPKIVIWGSGNALREFLYVDDMADACRFVMELSEREFWKNLGEDLSHLNIGSGQSISIKNLVFLLKEIMQLKAQLVFDVSKPDGHLRKILNAERLFQMGWQPRVSLEKGLQKTYTWFLENIA